MIQNAYHLLMAGQLEGVPRWANDDCFDIEAHVEEDPTIELGKAREFNLVRLQALLVNRFQLRTHWESKIQQGYVLVVGKEGLKLKPSEPGSGHRSVNGRGTLLCAVCSISSLSSYLSNFVKKPVQDATGVQGAFDINFKFEPLNVTPSQDDNLPSLFTGLQDQLGLKLEPRKIAVQVLVVDRIEHPSAN